MSKVTKTGKKRKKRLLAGKIIRRFIKTVGLAGKEQDRLVAFVHNYKTIKISF